MNMMCHTLSNLVEVSWRWAWAGLGWERFVSCIRQRLDIYTSRTRPLLTVAQLQFLVCRIPQNQLTSVMSVSKKAGISLAAVASSVSFPNRFPGALK